MRRADRLFQLMLILQEGRVRTARYIAEKLEVSERTVYRDIADLVGSGMPIDGEAGVGYLLRQEYRLPPLMFSSDELKALALGAMMVRAWSDKELGLVASNAIRKIVSILPERLKTEVELQEFVVPNFQMDAQTSENLGIIRRSIAANNKLAIKYRSLSEIDTDRIIWPFLLYFWGNKWTLGAWCEKREAFRSFRVDRVASLVVLQSQYEDDALRSLDAYVAYQRDVETISPGTSSMTDAPLSR